jgi:hypothetical protein
LIFDVTGIDHRCHFHAIAIARHHFEDLRSANTLIIAARLHPVPLQCAPAAAFATVAPLTTAVAGTSSRHL